MQAGGHVIVSTGSLRLGDVPAIPRLHQLPPPPADFTGREEDLSALRSALASGDAGTILSIRGMGGSGKTSLALKLAQELTSLYSDAQIYLDLMGASARPLTALQAMEYVIRSYHPEAQLPRTTAELASLYRSVLFGKKVLLFLDNALGQEQVEPLIPPAGSLLLLTSRFQFTLPGLYEWNLGNLPSGEARELLLRIAPHVGEAASEIAHLCGQLPLALRVAASTLAERRELSPAEYVRRLRKGKERLTRVEASLRLTYELLSEEIQERWRLLAVFTGAFDGRAAAAVWELELDPDRVADKLGALVRCSLLEWDGHEARYRLHDLVRELASRLSSDDERSRAARRHALYFLAELREITRRYQEPGGDTLSAVAAFDREWSDIQAAQSWATSCFPGDEEAARLTVDFPDAGIYLLKSRQHPRDRIRWRKAALKAARQIHDPLAEAVHLGNIGNTSVAIGHLRCGIRLYEQALAFFHRTGDQHRESIALANLGNAYAAFGQPRRAVEFFERALSIARELEDRQTEARIIGNLADTYAQIGDPVHAIELSEQALGFARRFRNLEIEVANLNVLGSIYTRTGKPLAALTLHEQALAIAESIGDRWAQGKTRCNLADARVALGQAPQAIGLYEQALEIARQLGDREGERTACANLATARALMGDVRHGLDLYEDALALTLALGDRAGEMQILLNRGKAAEMLGQRQLAGELGSRDAPPGPGGDSVQSGFQLLLRPVGYPRLKPFTLAEAALAGHLR